MNDCPHNKCKIISNNDLTIDMTDKADMRYIWYFQLKVNKSDATSYIYSLYKNYRRAIQKL